MPAGLTSSKSSPSGSAYVTFRRPHEASALIDHIDGSNWHGGTPPLPPLTQLTPPLMDCGMYYLFSALIQPAIHILGCNQRPY